MARAIVRESQAEGPAGTGSRRSSAVPTVALLTAGKDKHYALGLAGALIETQIPVVVIGGEDLPGSGAAGERQMEVINLRGSTSGDTPLWRRVTRVLRYYGRLAAFAVTARQRIFHILWNNSCELFDRTLLMCLYRACGRKVVLTAHNVNAGVRDGRDSWLNRMTLRIQYSLTDHIFVHTEAMRDSLHEDFGISRDRISVIPFGLNDAVPDTGLSRADARQRLGMEEDERVLLFFGNIAPYKGLEYLVEALAHLNGDGRTCTLLIAGRVKKGADAYWKTVQASIRQLDLTASVVARSEFIPDEEAEMYFRAADVLVLPYRHIFQSGVLFLGYHFGLPVIATDVGSLRNDVVPGETGFMCRPADSRHLAETIDQYFTSAIYANLESSRKAIRAFASREHSWSRVGAITRKVYEDLSTGA